MGRFFFGKKFVKFSTNFFDMKDAEFYNKFKYALISDVQEMSGGKRFGG